MTSTELRAWRNRLGLTQAVAAALLGLSTRQYARLEAGDGGITGTVAKLTRYVEIELATASSSPHAAPAEPA